MTLEQSLIADIPKFAEDEQAFMREISDRVLVVGRSRYAPWQERSDGRELVREALEEALDGCIYVAMQLLRLKRREQERKDRRLAERHDEAYAKVQHAIRASFTVDDYGMHEVLMPMEIEGKAS